MLDFSHVGVRGVWLNVQLDLRLGKKYCSGVSNHDLPLRKGAPKGPAVSQTRFLARGSSEK